MRSPLSHISVVIPLRPGETSWIGLARDLGGLPAGAEVIFVGPESPSGGDPGETRLPKGPSSAKVRMAWVRAPIGRARQLNCGAKSASNKFLWFLHADSRFAPNTLSALETALAKAPDALHYFKLRFLKDGPALMTLTALGAAFRSQVLGLPFGDQGFCISRTAFERVGRFDETASYGEDHLLVWQAVRHGTALRCTGGCLYTSARKYQANGWLQTTLRHQGLTYKQALPQLVKAWGLRRS